MSGKSKSESESEPESECGHSFPAPKVDLVKILKARVIDWFTDHVALFEALLIAVSFHVLLFPVIWLMGWALPWPRTPPIRTIIEINLENWPNEARPEKVESMYHMPKHKPTTK